MNASLESNRLIFRPLQLHDQAAVLELLTDDQVMRFLGPHRALSQEEAQAWFAEFLATQEQTPNRHAVALRSDNQLIGFCGVKLSNNTPDFGCFFRRSFWGQGHASEACATLLPGLWQRWGSSLDIFIADANVASVGLATKLGLVRGAKACRHNQQGNLYHYQPKPEAQAMPLDQTISKKT